MTVPEADRPAVLLVLENGPLVPSHAMAHEMVVWPSPLEQGTGRTPLSWLLVDQEDPAAPSKPMPGTAVIHVKRPMDLRLALSLALVLKPTLRLTWAAMETQSERSRRRLEPWNAAALRAPLMDTLLQACWDALGRLAQHAPPWPLSLPTGQSWPREPKAWSQGFLGPLPTAKALMATLLRLVWPAKPVPHDAPSYLIAWDQLRRRGLRDTLPTWAQWEAACEHGLDTWVASWWDWISPPPEKTLTTAPVATETPSSPVL